MRTVLGYGGTDHTRATHYSMRIVGSPRIGPTLAAHPLIPGNMASGKVKFFNTEKGFGFIVPDQGGKDVFVHKNGTREPISEGDAVTYDVEETPKGLNAINVARA